MSKKVKAQTKAATSKKPSNKTPKRGLTYKQKANEELKAKMNALAETHGFSWVEPARSKPTRKWKSHDAWLEYHRPQIAADRRRARAKLGVDCNVNGFADRSVELPYELEKKGPGNYWARLVRPQHVFIATRLAIEISKESKRFSDEASFNAGSLANKIEAFVLARGDQTVQAEIKEQWAAICKRFGAKIKPAPKDDHAIGRSDYFTITFKSGREFSFYPAA